MPIVSDLSSSSREMVVRLLADEFSFSLEDAEDGDFSESQNQLSSRAFGAFLSPIWNEKGENLLEKLTNVQFK